MEQVLTYTQVVDLLPAYARGELTPDVMLAVDGYLQQHRALFEQLWVLEERAAQTSRAMPQVELPGNVHERLMTRVRAAVPQATEAQRAAHALGRRGGGTQRWAFAALALLALTAVALGVLLGGSAAERTVLQRQVAQLRAITTQLEQRDANTTARIALLAETLQVVPLLGSVDAPEARGSFYLGADMAVLVLRGLPQLPTHQTYQFWLLPTNHAPVSAGVIGARAELPDWFSVSVPASLRDVNSVGLSIEPAGGSATPTGAIVLQSAHP